MSNRDEIPTPMLHEDFYNRMRASQRNRDKRDAEELSRLSIANNILFTSAPSEVTGTPPIITPAGSDTAAIHVDVVNEISGVVEKTALVTADLLIIEDSEASFIKKKVQLGSLSNLTWNQLQFDTSPSVTPAEGMIYWNPTDKTVNIKTDTDTVIQVGQELVLRIYNDLGVTLNNGEVVYISGANGGGRPTITLADATDINTSEDVVGIATSSISDTQQGFVTTFGLVRDLNTIGMVAGDEIFLSETPGEFTTTKPSFPAWVVSVGHVITVHATEGVIFFHPVIRDTFHAWNGTFNENFNALVTSNGTIITLSLERSGGGDLTMRFSDGFSILSCPPLTVALNAGTATVPQMNYVYVLKSAPTVMTVSTSSYPTAEHIKVGVFYVFTAALTNTDGGSLMNQNINNYTANVSNQRGRVELLSERMRKEGARYEDGIDPDGIESYFTMAAGSTLWKSTSGEIYQMHLQAVSALDLSAGDVVYAVNNAITPFERMTNLFSITTLADGTTGLSNNKYFNLVFWIVGNKSGEYTPLMVNLPTGQYTSQSAALRDDDKTAVYDIPREFRIDSSTAVFVCRAVFQMGATWSFVGVENLRGRDPTSAGGSSSGAVGNQVEFNDSTFRIFNNATNSKVIALSAATIADSTVRTITMPDVDVTLFNLLDEDDMASDSAIAAPSQQSVKAYVTAIGNWTPTNFANYTSVLDEDDMASDLDTALASQQSIKAYVDAGGVGTFVSLAGDTMTGNLSIEIASGSGNLSVKGTTEANIELWDTSGDSDKKRWGISANNSQMQFQQFNDAGAWQQNWMAVTPTAIYSQLNHNFSAGIDVTGNATVTAHAQIGSIPLPSDLNASYKAIQLNLAVLQAHPTSDSFFIQNNARYTTASDWKYIVADTAQKIQMSGGEMKFSVAAAGSIDGVVTWIDALTIDVAGAATFADILTIEKSVDGDFIALALKNTFGGGGTATSVQQEFYQGHSATNPSGKFVFQELDTADYRTNFELYLIDSNADEEPTLAMQVNYAGKLTVYGGAQLNGDVTMDGGDYIFDSATRTKKFYITRIGGTDQSLAISVDDSNVHFESEQDEDAGAGGGFTFTMDDDSTQTPSFKINEKSGAILFDLDTDARQLNVGDSSNPMTMKIESATLGGLQIRSSSSSIALDLYGTSAIDNMVFRGYGSTTDYWTIVVSSGGVKLVSGATSWVSASDIRFKDNVIKPLVLDKILQLDTIEYDLWEYDELNVKKTFAHQIGVSAQQLQEQFPMLVFGNEKEDKLSVDYTHMSAIFIGAIKELNNKIVELENKIELLSK